MPDWSAMATKEQQREWGKKWAANNPDKIRAAKRRYQERNKDKRYLTACDRNARKGISPPTDARAAEVQRMAEAREILKKM